MPESAAANGKVAAKQAAFGRVTEPVNQAPERIAAIDIGSNSIRQIVADVSPSGEIRVIDEMKAAPRLGTGLSRTGHLDKDAMQRAVEAVTRMVTLGRQLGAGRVEVVATSAVREAANARTFVTMLRRHTGLRLRVLSGDDEARLGFTSALAHFDLAVGRAVVVDIGGGSLELALSADGLVDRLISMPFGALHMMERFLTDTCRRKHVRRLRSAVRDELRVRLGSREWRGARMIGSGGTFTNLAGMALAREGMEAAQTVHGTRVSRAEVEHILDSLQDTTLSERQAVSGLNPARADIIVAGLAVVAELMARLETHELVVSHYGIREGLLLETARVKPARANTGEARQRSLLRLAQACRFEERHALQVQKLALQLFDSLGSRLGCQPEERQILADAALLHDIGYHISYEKHHKHSYYLILHADLLGMSPGEQVAIANVARYHRGSAPKRKHSNFGALDSKLRGQIKRLAAILRVADGFDRGHVAAVGTLRVRWLARAIRITPVPRGPRQNLRLEIWGASRKLQLLSRLASCPLEVVDSVGAVAAHSGDAKNAA